MGPQTMTEAEIEAEEAWFEAHWDEIGPAVRFALARSRALGPAGLAEQVTHPADAMSSGWCEWTDTPMGVLSERRSLPFMGLRLEASVGPEEGRLERIMALAETAGQAEQQRFAEALVPDTVLDWTTGKLSLGTLDPELTHDAVINLDTMFGQALLPHQDWLEATLGGQLIWANLGTEVPTLVIPAEALTVHVAGGRVHSRPSAGLVRIETVSAIECAPDTVIHAIAPRPGPVSAE